MAETSRQFAYSDYTVGWICALPKIELVAALAMLDEEHPTLPAADSRDTNTYVLGRIGDHNVVIACLPAEMTGKASAASVATDMVRSFKGVRVGLMVGVGGGAPYFSIKNSSGAEDEDSEDGDSEDDSEGTQDIRLGDVVISLHSKDSDAVLQYDFGKSEQEKNFIRSGGKLNKPPIIVLSAVSILQAKHALKGHKITEQLSNIVSQNPRMATKFKCPGSAKDRFFKSEIVHVEGKRSCKACCGLLDANLVKRKARIDLSPRLHYGTIGSADQVMKDALLRDKWARHEKIKCFEMEAAGLMDSFPCLVIRGICDYADSHKNEIWQPYAAATAAAYAKELLLYMPGQGVEALSPIEQTLHDQTTLIRSINRKIDLAKLPSVESAAFDSHSDEHEARCLPGTRTALLREITEWAENAHGKTIFWLNGMAGTGKSTISRTIAQSFAQKRQLGASFFFKKGEGNRGNASRFFTTIAAQLTTKIPNIGPLIGEVIDADPSISEKTLKEQFERLIFNPLSRIPRVYPQAKRVILVVDALDECEREDDIRIILSLLPLFRDVTSVFLRVFVTSRPDLPIRLGFGKMPGGTYEDLVLHDIPQATIKHDISIFLQDKLAEIRVRRSLNTDWPSQEDIQALVEIAVPLFIFAATVCRFVAENVGNPRRRLATIIGYQNENKNKASKLDTQMENKNRVSKLDAIYLPILEQLFVMQDKVETQKLAEEFREVVGTIVILADPLSTISLANLLGVEKYDITCKLDLLHSVINVPADEGQPVKLLHLSFREFLLDPERSRNSPFWVDEEEEHERIASKCLQLMSKHNCLKKDNCDLRLPLMSKHNCLKKDICDLRLPGIIRDEIDTRTVNTFLPAEVQYACRYWFYHLKRAHRSLKDNDQVHMFLQEHLLHWLEAMSLLRGTSESIMMITGLLSICKADECPNLHAFIYDAKRFTLYNQSMIKQAPLQLYCSALVFAPENSIVRKLFERYIPPWVHRKSRIWGNWNSTLQALEGHSHELTSVAFSSNANVVASGSHDRTVKLWNAVTGTALQTLEGHSHPIISVAFSPDDKVVWSASDDGTVKLWNSVTGTSLQTLKCQRGRISSVAFSADGKVIASASMDRTVWLWDVVTGANLQTLVSHSGVINSMAFSLNGKVVATASSDCTVMLWNAVTGAALKTLEGHLDEVTAVAFSPDGKMVGSSSDDETVRLWDAMTGAALQTLEGHSNHVNSVAFSPNSKVIASASMDKTVRLWDTVTGGALQTFKGHSSWVTSVAFSPDGKEVASASGDGRVRLWDAVTKSTLQTLEGHSDVVTALAFSPDGKVIGSASEDGTVRLWDAVKIAALKTLVGHSSQLFSVAFSPDGKVIASASEEGEASLWDAETGIALQTLDGHWGRIASAAFLPDGKMVASASDGGTVRFWDAVTGVALQTLQGHSDTISVAFSPDGKMVASGSGDKIVRLWNAVTSRVIRTLEGHSDAVTAVAFSPDGKVVASASIDRTARLWDSVTGDALQTLKLGIWTYSLSFCGSGQYLETDRGSFRLEPYRAFLDLKERSTALSVGEEWVKEDEKCILWLPPDYRATCVAVSKKLVVLGHSSGEISYLEVTEGSKIV